MTGLQPSLSLDDDPKQHGTWPTKQYSAVQKRSYKRACKRAIQTGCSWYHGKCIPLHEFPTALVETLKQSTRSHSHVTPPVRSRGPHKTRSKPSINVLNWNPGGLGDSRFAELKTWLSDTDFNVVVLPETRWSFQNEREDDHWCYFHSGDSSASQRVSGVLVMVSKELCRSHNMLWTSIIPGRLVHIRLMGLTRNVDIVACYQASTDTPSRLGDSKDVRAEVFQSLDALISTLPQRNVLLVAGDFNCSLQNVPGCCGTQTYRWNGEICPNVAYADSGTFAQILAQHHLIALNTWNGRDGPTFVHQHFQRRIDFILCRKSSVDNRALNVKQLWNFPMLPLTGYHVPLACQLSRTWCQAAASAPARRFSMRQRLQCRQWHCSQSFPWQRFQRQLQQDLLDFAETDSSDVIACLHNQVSSRFQEFWENQAPPLTTTGRGDQVDVTARSLAFQKWHHWRLCKRQTLHTVRGFFDGWFHAARFLSLKRLLQRQLRHWKQQRFADVLNEAQEASTHHDLGKLHRLINRISPKQQRVKIRLRTEQGSIAGPHEEHSLFCAFVQDKWNPDRLISPPPLQESWHVAPGVPFTMEALELGIRQLPVLKAVAFPYAPAQVIQCQSQSIAQILYPILQRWWNQFPRFIPQEWKDGWMVWLPKPNKQPSQVAHLRPLALAEPVGKVVVSLIAKAAAGAISDRLCRRPQFAYMANRGTTDALWRAAIHCEKVTDLIQTQQSSVKNKRDHQPRLTCYGGIQVCLDLSRAFDQAHRDKIFRALRRLGAGDDLCTLLQFWHHGTRYVINSGGSETACLTCKGVRQGCTAAPALRSWALPNKLLRRKEPWVGGWVPSLACPLR